MKAYIYSLKDPNTSEVMYVGKTIDPKRRECQHLTDGINKNKTVWINELREDGRKPIFEVIEECNTNDCDEREAFYIEKFKSSIFNVNPAGGGGVIKQAKDKLFKFNFFLDEETRNLLEAKKREYGFSSVAGFIRYIIIKFFDKK